MKLISLGILVLGLTTVGSAAEVYKVILKGGAVLEAKSRPVAMEGNYRFTGADGKFRVIPAGEVDQEATRKANATVTAERRPKVITNDDVPATSETSAPPQPAVHPAAEASQPAAEGQSGEAGGESYWRAEAAKLRGQMAQVEAQIARLKDEIAKMGASSVTYAGPQENVYYVKDRQAELNALEAQKKALDDQFAALEDRGRKAGASPGWFR